LGKIVDAELDLIKDPCEAVDSTNGACRAALALDSANVNLMLRACFAFFKAAAACYGLIRPDDFKVIWRNALWFIEGSALTNILGKYLVALAAVGRLDDVESELKKWEYILEADQRIAPVTYAALAMFDVKYAEKALAYLPPDVKNDLPRYATTLYKAVNMQQLPNVEPAETREPIGEVETLLMLSFLGIAFCKQPWGRKLAKAAARALARTVQRYRIRIDYYLHAFKGLEPDSCTSVARKAVRAYYHLI